ncbi:MAG: glutamate racemase [Clostridia bacterium]|nr:glutamate racemase [Clostridia bacterium]
MGDQRAIGIFDSGLGGLTVVKEIVKLLPQEDIVYFGDTGRVPYGTRSRETICKYAREDERFLLQKDVKLIVAACGTVSSVAVDAAEGLPVPFVEVVSHSVSAAVKATKNKKIGVLGTAATIRSGAHRRQILEQLPDATVVENSATLFVPLVEEGWFSADDPVVLETVRRYLQPMIDAQVDTVILGCTHFPVLSEAIHRVMGEAVTLINMGTATALAVVERLAKFGLATDRKETGIHRFYVSDKAASFRKIASVLLGEDLCDGRVEQVDINGI